jgi:hypothetical protein
MPLCVHDSTAENMRLRWSYLERHGRPVSYDTDKASLFQSTPKIARNCTEVPRDEQAVAPHADRSGAGGTPPSGNCSRCSPWPALSVPQSERSPAPTRPLCPRFPHLLESAAQSSFGRPAKSGPAIVAFSVFKASAREFHRSMLATPSKTLGGHPAGSGCPLIFANGIVIVNIRESGCQTRVRACGRLRG